jgi:hypothetical protein
MMYFTEGKSAVEDPVALNEEFDSQCNTAEYEKNIAGRTWDDAIR